MFHSSLVDLSNIMTGSNNFTLRKANARPHRYEKIYMVKDSTEDKLYELIDQFNKEKDSHRDFHSELKICIRFRMEMGQFVRYYFIYS